MIFSCEFAKFFRRSGIIAKICDCLCTATRVHSRVCTPVHCYCDTFGLSPRRTGICRYLNAHRNAATRTSTSRRTDAEACSPQKVFSLFARARERWWLERMAMTLSARFSRRNGIIAEIWGCPCTATRVHWRVCTPARCDGDRSVVEFLPRHAGLYRYFDVHRNAVTRPSRRTETGSCGPKKPSFRS